MPKLVELKNDGGYEVLSFIEFPIVVWADVVSSEFVVGRSFAYVDCEAMAAAIIGQDCCNKDLEQMKGWVFAFVNYEFEVLRK